MPIFHNVIAGAAGQSGGANAGYKIERSLRFNSTNSSKLYRTATAGNRQRFTLSWWMKRCVIDESNRRIFGKSTGSQQFSIMHDSNGRFYTYFNLDSPTDTSSQTFAPQYRDPNAWAHYVLAFDTSQSTDSDRIKFYYNGVRVTDFIGTPNWPSQNASFKWNNAGDTYYIGGIGAYHINAYLAEIHHVDGQQLDCTSFGEFSANTGAWNPIEFTGTHGTNGFHLNFADTSSTTNGSNTGIGKDVSGNGNYWDTDSITASGTATTYRTSELSEPGSSVNYPFRAFNATYISSKINTSSWAVTSTNWEGAFSAAVAELRWIPAGGYAVSNSLRVYYGVYDNSAKTTTLTITYTDGSTETDSFTSSNNNWMKLFTASNAAGKTVQKVELSPSTPQATNLHFGGFVVDDQIVTTLNAETDSFIDTPTVYEADSGNHGGNYATLSPVNALMSAGTISGMVANGNLTKTNVSSTYGKVRSTIPVHFGGKTYFEVTCAGSPDSNDYIGFEPQEKTLTSASGFASGDMGFSGAGSISPGGSSYASAGWSAGDVLGFYFDYPNQEVGYFLNGVDQNQGFNSFDTTVKYLVAVQDWSNAVSGTFHFNFGQRPFVYTNAGTDRPAADFKPLGTAYYDDPPIEDPGKYFNAKTYVGTSGADLASAAINTSTAYRHHRILCEGDNNGGSISEIQFFDASGLIDASDTNNAGGSISSNKNQGLDAWTAFNGTLGGASYSYGVRKDPSSGFYIAKDWGAGVTKTITAVKIWGVNSYAIAGNTAGKYVKLQGSNDGSNWTDLQTWSDSRTGSWTTSSSTVPAHTSDTSTVVSGYDFSADLLWIKSLTNPGSGHFHHLMDTVRGLSGSFYNALYANDTVSENTYAPATHGGITQINDTGFVLAKGSTASSNHLNYEGIEYIGWAWEAGTGATPNTDGSQSSSVNASPASGFSIVSYSGSLNGAGNGSIGHGLGIAPTLVITKDRDNNTPWIVQHADLGTNEYLKLNENVTPLNSQGIGGGLLPKPTSSVFYGTWLAGLNVSGNNYIGYCFAPVDQYFATGTYEGNQNPTSGNVIYCGFSPALILVKYIDSAGQWYLYDSTRSPNNVAYQALQASQPDGENTSDGSFKIDILSSGFKMRQTNGPNNNGTYIWAAWAETPFKYARAR